MGLLAVQTQLAGLLAQEDALRDFARDRRGFARATGLRGKDAILLAGLDAGGLAYFARRRRIDRTVMLRADMPRTVALLGERGLAGYFRRHPFALESPVHEAKRLAAWLAPRPGAVGLGDLARLEHAQLRVTKRAHRTARPTPYPKRSPGVILLTLQHRVDTPLPRRSAQAAFYAILRQADGVTWLRYGALENALMQSANGSRTEQAWLRFAARQAGRSARLAKQAAQALRREGLVAPLAL